MFDGYDASRSILDSRDASPQISFDTTSLDLLGMGTEASEFSTTLFCRSQVAHSHIPAHGERKDSLVYAFSQQPSLCTGRL